MVAAAPLLLERAASPLPALHYVLPGAALALPWCCPAPVGAATSGRWPSAQPGSVRH